jgi:hypothetical protein
MTAVLQLVDAVGSTTVRLDLNAPAAGQFALAGPPDAPAADFSPPPLRRATSGTFMTDGQRPSASAYDNRIIRFSLYLLFATALQRETALSALAQELDQNYATLRLQWDGATQSTWYRLLRSAVSDQRRVGSDLDRILVDLELLAEPFGLGAPVVLGAGTPPQNANPYFEVDASNWAGVAGTVVRSTAQAHEGVGSLLITPSGAGNTHADAERIGDGSLVAGRGYRATAWRYSAGGYASGFGPRINFYDAAIAYLSTLGTPAALGAAAWAQGDTGTQFAPAAAVYSQLIASYTGTPTAGQTAHIDEAMIWATGEYQVANDPAAVVNGLYFDVDGVKGDVEALAKIELSGAGSDMAPILAVRRHGTPANITPVVQAEAGTLGTDTTIVADSNFSGGSKARCSFGTDAGMVTRLTVTLPSTGGQPYVDRRGRYRILLVAASSAGSTTYAIRMKVDSQYGAAALLTGDPVTWAATDTSRRVIDLSGALGLLQVPLGQDPIYDGYGAEKEVSAVPVQIQAQRVSGSGSLDLDYVIALPADEELCNVGQIYTTGGAYDAALDGMRRSIWVPYNSAIGEVHAYGASPIPKMGGFLRLAPGQVNRIWLLRPDAVGTGTIKGPDTKTRTTTVRVTYWPAYLSWAP